MIILRYYAMKNSCRHECTITGHIYKDGILMTECIICDNLFQVRIVIPAKVIIISEDTKVLMSRIWAVFIFTTLGTITHVF